MNPDSPSQTDVISLIDFFLKPEGILPEQRVSGRLKLAEWGLFKKDQSLLGEMQCCCVAFGKEVEIRASD